jgi:glycosyltransferase involved in cell wall biosynthesis
VRLLILNQFYAPDISPTAQLAASLAEHRAAAGDRVTVITSRTGYTGRPLERGDHASTGVRVIRLPLLGLGRARTAGRLLDYLVFGALATARAAVLRRHDVVISMTTPPFLVLGAVAHRLLHPGSRVVLWSMDCYPDAAERFGTMRPGGIPSRFFRALKRWAFRRVDHLVALDCAMRDLLLLAYAPEDRDLPATVIPNWERADLFPAEPPPRWAAYDDEPDLRGRFVVVYLGNAGMGHDFGTVVDAAGRLADDGVAFLFIGGGIRTPDLERARAGGATNIVLRGYVPKEETPSVMAGAGAALIALDDDALGVMSPSKLHGYLGMALPVLYVGPEGSNVSDALAQHGCGIEVRQGDVAGFVAAVKRLRDPDLRADMARRARAAFEDAYCDSRTLPQWDALLAGLAG